MIKSQRPNILFAVADDASHMSAYGHKFLNTPNFDFVANEGMLFKNAFTTNPKCSPSRASILTGMHTWQLEDACCHYGYFPSKFEVYPNVLEKSGYAIGYTGKGWAPGDWKSTGFSHNPAGPEFNTEKLVPPVDTKISEIDYASNFEVFLKNKKADQPFCFWYGGKEPHRPYVYGEGKNNGNKPEDIKLPRYFPDDDIVRNDIIDYAYEIEWFDKHLGLMINKLKENGEFENTIILVTSDNGMPFPRVKGQMYEDDFHLPMAMCWKEATEGKRIVSDLISFVDFAPTFYEAAGIEIPKQVEGKSMMDLIFSKPNVYKKDRDYVYMGRERHDLGRENDLGYPVRCIRNKEFLYVRNFKPDRWPAGNPETGFTNCDSSPTKELVLKLKDMGVDEVYYELCFGKRPDEELYNVSKDPECLNNLAKNPECDDIRKKLRDRLLQKLADTNDPRIIADGDIFERYEYVGSAPHSWRAYKEGRFKKQNY